MAKAIKAALKQKQAKQQQQNSANSKAGKKALKMTAKAIATLKGIGEHIVQQTIDSGDSVATAFFKCFGKTEAELEKIGEGMADAWKAALAKLKKDCATWASKMEARDEQSAYSKQAQVYYNRASEGKAILKMFGVWAALPAKDKAKARIAKDVHDMETAPRRYDTLVMYARHVNNPAKRGTNKPENAAVTRARNAWKKKTPEQVKKVKQLVKFATLAGLLEIREYIEDQIAKLKKRAPAEVHDIKKAQRAKAINAKLRKAAGMRKTA